MLQAALAGIPWENIVIKQTHAKNIPQEDLTPVFMILAAIGAVIAVFLTVSGSNFGLAFLVGFPCGMYIFHVFETPKEKRIKYKTETTETVTPVGDDPEYRIAYLWAKDQVEKHGKNRSHYDDLDDRIFFLKTCDGFSDYISLSLEELDREYGILSDKVDNFTGEHRERMSLVFRQVTLRYLYEMQDVLKKQGQLKYLEYDSKT